MAGWGERKGPSAEQVERRLDSQAGHVLALVVEQFLAAPTTSNRDRMAVAARAVRERTDTRTLAAAERFVPPPGAYC